MRVPSALSPFLRAGAVAVLAAGLWAATAVVTPMPPLFPLGPQPVYTAADRATLVSLEPVLHAAWLGTPPRPVVWLVATIILLGASGVAVFAGASTLAAVAILAALVLDTSFSAALSHASGLAVAVGFVWLAAGAAFDSQTRLFTGRPWFNPLSALLLWALAVWWDWTAVVMWPVVWAAFRRTPDRPARGLWTFGSLLLGGAAFIAHFAWMADAAHAITVDAGAVSSWRDAIAIAFDARPRMPIGSFAAPELTTRLSYLVMVLAVVGLLFGTLGRWWRPTVLLSALIALGTGLVWSEWQAEIVRFSLWVLAPLAAVGLTWVASQGRRPIVITTLLGGIAVGETMAAGARPLEGTDARRFRDLLVAELEDRARTSPLLIVAEDTRVDSALVPWIASRAPRVQRAPQRGEVLAGARREGQVALAGPTARRQLELSGLSLVETVTIGEPAPFVWSEVETTFRCSGVRTDRWSQLPGLEYTGRLGLEIPAWLGGELQLVVGDDLPLPLRAATPEGNPVTVRLDALLSGPGAAAPPADYWIDRGTPEDGSRWLRRAHVAADPFRTRLLSLHLGRRAPRVIARLVGYVGDPRGRICAAPVGPLRLRAGDTETVSLDDEDAFGVGWYGLEGRGTDAFRWADVDAVVLLRSAVKTDVEVSLGAAPAATGPGSDSTIALRVNGIEVGAYAMSAGAREYRWKVPAGVWLAGTNELWWTTSRAVRPADGGGSDTRNLAIRVAGITVRRR